MLLFGKTEEQVNIMVARYTENPNRETVDSLAEEFNKSIKSIIYDMQCMIHNM